MEYSSGRGQYNIDGGWEKDWQYSSKAKDTEPVRPIDDQVIPENIFEYEGSEILLEQIEQSLLEGADIPETVEAVRGLSAKQAHRLGQFLIRVATREKYAPVFYECWHWCDAVQQGSLTDELEKSPSRAAAMFLAPFGALEDLTVWPEGRQGKSQTWLELFISDFDSAQKFVENIIYFHQRFQVSWARSNLKRVLNTSLSRRVHFNPLFLAPYMSELEEMGLYSAKKEMQVIVLDEDSPFFRQVENQTLNFLTDQEQAELHKKYAKRNDKDLGIDSWLEWAQQSAILWPEVRPFVEKANLRQVDALVKWMQVVAKGDASVMKELFTGVLDKGSLPVLTKATEFGFTTEEWQKIILYPVDEDELFQTSCGNELFLGLLAVRDVGHEHDEFCNPDFEKSIISSLKRKFHRASLEYAPTELRLEKILPHMSPVARKSVISSLQNEQPQVFLREPEYYSKAGGDLVELLNDFTFDVTTEGLRQIWHDWNQPEIQRRLDKPARQRFIEKVRQEIETNDELDFFDSSIWPIIQVVFRPEEQVRVARNIINTREMLYVRSIFSSPLFPHLKTEVVKLLASSPASLRNLMFKYTWPKVCDKMALSEWADLWVRGLAHVEARGGIDMPDYQVLLGLAEVPGFLGRANKALLQNAELTADLWDYWNWFLSKLDQLRELPDLAKSELPKLQLELNNWRRVTPSYQYGSSATKQLENKIESIKQDLVVRDRVSGLNECLELKKQFVDSAKKILLDNPELIFEVDIEKYFNEEEVKRLVGENLAEAVKKNAEIMFREREFGSGNYTYQDILGHYEFNKCLTELEPWLIGFAMKNPDQVKYRKKIVRSFSETLPNARLVLSDVEDDDEDDDGGLNPTWVDKQMPKSVIFYGTVKEQLVKTAKSLKRQIAKKELYASEVFKTEFSKLNAKARFFSQVPMVQKFESNIRQWPKVDQMKLWQDVEMAWNLNALDLIFSKSDDLQTWHESIQEFNQKELRERLGLDVNELDPEGELNPELIRHVMIYEKSKQKAVPEISRLARDVVQKVSDGVFQNWRDWGMTTKPETEEQEQNQLEKMIEQGLLPSGVALPQYKQWVAEVSFSSEAEANAVDKSDNVEVKKILDLAVNDGHIDRQVLDINLEEINLRWNEIKLRMKELDAKKVELQEKEKIAKQMWGEATGVVDSELVFTGADREDLRLVMQQIKALHERAKPEMQNLKVQCMLGKLGQMSEVELATQKIDVLGQKYDVSRVLDILKEQFVKLYPDFINDLQNIKLALVKKVQTVKNEVQAYTVTDKVNFAALFEIGDKPVKSCQNYESTEHSSTRSNNNGLIATVIDPGVRMIQVYNTEQNLIGRAVMRLMENESGQPVIFTERVYSSSQDGVSEKLINQLLQDKAQQMGCFFYSENIYYNGPKVSMKVRGSRAPYVYSDAGLGLVKGDKLKIRFSRTLAQ